MSRGAHQPLAGVRVVVTRATHQAGALTELLEAAGADVEPLPLLEIAPPDDPAPLHRAAAELGRFDWVILTSANAVKALAAALPGAWPRRSRVAVVGAATASALRRAGREADLVPREAQAEGVLTELAPRLQAGQRILLPQAPDARPVLAEGLLELGVEVVTVTAYGKRLPASAPERFAELFAHRELGWVTFTSPSTAYALAALAGERWSRGRAGLRAASVGPVTSGALRKLGVEPAAEATHPGDRPLVAAICAAVTGQ